MLTTVGLFGVGVITMQVRQVARMPQECFANGWLWDWIHFTLQGGTMWSCLQTILASYFLNSSVQCAESICGSISSTSVCITVSLDFLLGWRPLFRLTGLDLRAPTIVYCDSFAMVMVEKTNKPISRENLLSSPEKKEALHSCSWGGRATRRSGRQWQANHSEFNDRDTEPDTKFCSK